MSDHTSPQITPAFRRGIGRAIVAALAIVDSLLFLYLLVNFGWFNFNYPDVSGSIAGLVLLPLFWGIIIVDRLFALSYFVAVGAGIWKDLAGRERPRWAAVLTTPVLLIALAGTAFVWFVIVRGVLADPPGMMHDRLTLFDALARNWPGSDVEMLGALNYVTGSIGGFLIVMLAVLYLAEKYLVQSWRVRWPIPIAPLVAIGWIGWIAYDGEQRQRQYVAAQQWEVVGAQLPWLDAVDACVHLGQGWRLPRREELARFIASHPPDIQSWEGWAWTSQSARGGEWAIGVDLAPRKSGRWNKASEPTRDESLCEFRDQPGYASDTFASYRDAVCARTNDSPYLFTPGLHPTALVGGVTVTHPPGGAICIHPAGDTKFPFYQRRGYEGEREFTTVKEFRDAMNEQCRTSPGNTRAACFAYAPDLPPFDESGDERLMRAFCELAWNGEACERYAVMMDGHSGSEARAARYHDLACKRGYVTACK